MTTVFKTLKITVSETFGLDPKVELDLLEKCENLVEAIINKIKFRYNKQGELLVEIHTSDGYEFYFYLDEKRTINRGEVIENGR